MKTIAQWQTDYGSGSHLSRTPQVVTVLHAKEDL